MADNVYYNQPNTGTVIATDDISSTHYQKIKLVDGTADSTAAIPGDATNGLDVDVTRVIPGTAATALGKAEDAAHSSGDVGVMVLSVRQDTAAALSGTTGDYQPLTTDDTGLLRVRSNGYLYHLNDGWVAPGIDAWSKAQFVISSEHHHVHEGRHFYYQDNITLGATSQDYIITTPNTEEESHFGFEVFGTGKLTVELFEGADRSGTTLQTQFCSNRRSSNTPTMTIHKDQSGGTTDGTRIHWTIAGAGTKTEAVVGTSEELALGKNKKYLFRVTSAGTGNDIHIHMSHYEHGTDGLEARNIT